ncbi:FtsX-like permease family protein [Streptomyces sp. NPDC048392]|uniref:FtsX-like permease family protein n=1 Tax=Streptomyces sp. NPDC048392 TaxID=3365543 RepID=UPI0037244E3F
MTKLAAKLLRRRVGSALATLTALVLGIMILSTMGAMVESGLRYEPPPGEYTGADLVVARKSLDVAVDGEHTAVDLPEGGSVPAALAEKIRQVPGVTGVVADTRVAVLGRGPAVGHGWSSAPITSATIVAGEPPGRADEVVLDQRLVGEAEPGERTQLVVGGMTRKFRVSGIAAATTHAGTSVFFTDERVAALAARPGRVNAIGVITEPNADISEVTAAIGALVKSSGAKVHPASELRVDVDENDAAQKMLVALGTSLGGYVALLVMFVVSGTIGLSVRHRRRDLALLRAIGAAPGQVRRMLVMEAALIALAGAAIGIPAGIAATRWVHGQFVDRGFLPTGFPMASGLLSCLAAVLITVLVAMVSALIAARRITGIRPSEALGEAAVEPAHSGRVRALSGVLALAGAGAASVFAAGGNSEAALGSAMGMLFMFIFAVALLGPWINRAGARLLSPALRRVWGDSGYLAGRNLTANAQGMTTVLTALVLSVGFGGSVWFLQDNLQRQTISQTREGTLADHALASPVGLPASAAAQARRLPGVQAVTEVRNTSVLIKGSGDGEPVAARAVDPAHVAVTIDPAVTSGSLADLGTDGVAVSALRAGSSGWSVGDTAEVWLGDGARVDLRVAAVYDRALGFGDMILPRSVVEQHTARDLDDQLLIRTSPGKNIDKDLAALAARYPGSTVTASADLNQQLEEDLAVSAWMNKLVIGVMVGYAALAAANTMVMAALARRRELALLRLVGVTKRQVKHMVHAEQTVLLGVALLIGGVIAATTLSAVVNALTGDPVPYVPPLGWVAVLGGTALLALTTTVLPIGRLLLIPPVESIGIKE